jgi:hypothetical protein
MGEQQVEATKAQADQARRLQAAEDRQPARSSNDQGTPTTNTETED